MVIIRIPTPLRGFVAGKDQVSVEGSTVKEALDSLESQYPGIKSRLLDPAGEVRRFINLYVNETDVRSLQGLNSETKIGDALSIIPAIAGGARPWS